MCACACAEHAHYVQARALRVLSCDPECAFLQIHTPAGLSPHVMYAGSAVALPVVDGLQPLVAPRVDPPPPPHPTPRGCVVAPRDPTLVAETNLRTGASQTAHVQMNRQDAKMVQAPCTCIVVRSCMRSIAPRRLASKRRLNQPLTPAAASVQLQGSTMTDARITPTGVIRCPSPQRNGVASSPGQHLT